MAASICTASRLAAPWAYCWKSTRLTTPPVTEMLSPPVGYPTTVTPSCSSGMSPSGSGATSAQKASSSTASIARSHSWEMPTTRAVNLMASPCLRTWQCVVSATTCALVMMRRPSMQKPLPVESRCGLLVQGMR